MNCVLLVTMLAAGANHRSANFSVEAPTVALAEQIGQEAERSRKDLAVAWLGQELPTWTTPCPLEARITTGPTNGGSSVEFDRCGKVTKQRIWVEGPLDRILRSILPHEMTHILFAHHFGRQPPRWVDEGGAILAETRYIRNWHDQNLWRALETRGPGLAFARFFDRTEYPADVKLFYAQSASLTRFLVEQGDRPKFLAFVAQGMREGWETALKNHYRFRSPDELEVAWLRHQRTEALASK